MRPSSDFPGSNPFSEWTISVDDADARIARAIRICVGNYIREMYGAAVRVSSELPQGTRKFLPNCI